MKIALLQLDANDKLGLLITATFWKPATILIDLSNEKRRLKTITLQLNWKLFDALYWKVFNAV